MVTERHELRSKLTKRAYEHIQLFSWDLTAKNFLKALNSTITGEATWFRESYESTHEIGGVL